MYSYYDIDAILAEEELIPVSNIFDFPYLAHLDPDYVACDQSSRLYFHPKSSNSTSTHGSDSLRNRHLYLRKNTNFHMPLWSLVNWSKVQQRCISIKLPKHFRQRTRDRLLSDPVSVDLRSLDEKYFMSGLLTVHLVSLYKARHPSNSRRNTPDPALDALVREVGHLDQCLRLTYTGARLRRIFDWAMSNIDDDISSFTQNLTTMELDLFRVCSAATHAYTVWMMRGSRRIFISDCAVKLMSSQTSKENRAKFNYENMNRMDQQTSSTNKRIRV